MAQPLSYGCTWQLVSTHEAAITLSYCLMGGCKHKRSACKSNHECLKLFSAFKAN